MSEPLNIRDFFDEHFPQALQRELIEKCIIRPYREAYDECEGAYLEQEAHDLMGYVRRAKIEQSLQQLGDRHMPDGVRTSVELNSVENWHHRRVTAGRITFTASAVENPKKLPRPAGFRYTLARISQPYLDGFAPEPLADAPPPSDADLLYGLLIHYPDSDRRNLVPAFVHMVFPDPDCMYYVERIDLAARFPDLFVRKGDVDGVVEPRPGIELRPDIATQEEEGA